MRLIIQKKDDSFCVGGDLGSMEEVKQGAADILKDDGPDIFEMATKILESFPRFNEVIVSTQLTYDGQGNHNEDDNA